ncbi:MAG: hypothetical protein JOZ87_10890 [Chloroflexi bacterium]|nr:hypothetical protein [Chloroflexota bacterium]
MPTRIMPAAGVLLAVLLMLGPRGAPQPTAAQAEPAPSTVTPFLLLPFTQSWTVPPGVTSATVVLLGAGGGDGSSQVLPVAGGRGAFVQATLGVKPGETLQVRVGGRGGRAGDARGSDNGGGGFYPVTLDVSRAAGRGGGASDVRRSPYRLVDRLVVAGGGGGGGSTDLWGKDGLGGAGGDSGAPGLAGRSFVGSLSPGGGGAPGGTGRGGSGGAGGSAGRGDTRGSDGPDGTQGVGGSMPRSNENGGDGGGGGGGYYGGGAGGQGASSGHGAQGSGAGGGGGGSDFVTADATDVIVRDGVQAGDGLVVISYQSPGE